jgi:ankyrin repeat protein
MLRLPRDRRSQVQLGLVVALLVLFAAAVTVVATHFNQVALNAELNEAVFGRNYDDAHLLVTMGAQLDGLTFVTRFTGRVLNYHPPLHHAISGGDLEMVRVLIGLGADLYPPNGFLTDSALLCAVRYHEDAIARYLVHESGKIDMIQEDLHTLLHLSALVQNQEGIELAITHGVNVDSKNYHGETALHHAAKSGDVAIVQMLIRRGAELDIVGTLNFATPLSLACKRGHTEAALKLIEAGSDIQIANQDGDTPLHNAVYSDSPKLVRALLKAGANSSVKNREGRTALEEARYWKLSSIEGTMADWGDEDPRK